MVSARTMQVFLVVSLVVDIPPFLVFYSQSFDLTDLGLVSPGIRVLCPSWRSQNKSHKRLGLKLARLLCISFLSSVIDFQTNLTQLSSTKGNVGIQSNGTRLIKSSPASAKDYHPGLTALTVPGLKKETRRNVASPRRRHYGAALCCTS